MAVSIARGWGGVQAGVGEPGSPRSEPTTRAGVLKKAAISALRRRSCLPGQEVDLVSRRGRCFREWTPKMQELGQRTNVVQRPRLRRHFEIHSHVASVAHQIPRLEMRPLRLCATSNVKEALPPPEKAIISRARSRKILRFTGADGEHVDLFRGKAGVKVWPPADLADFHGLNVRDD